MPDFRWQTCPNCGGDGGFESAHGYDPRDGSPLVDWNRCSSCNGNGDVLVDTEMHAEDWLEKWEQEESA